MYTSKSNSIPTAYILVVNRGEDYEAHMGDQFDVIPIHNVNVTFHTFELCLDTALYEWEYLEERIYTSRALDKQLFIAVYDSLDSVLEYWENRSAKDAVEVFKLDTMYLEVIKKDKK